MSAPGQGLGVRPRVVVVGGGLAGLSAAIGCLDGGASVTLLEARPRLGGATWSFTRNGLSFDNGQHVYLRCCTAYQRFLERIGTAHLAPLQDRMAIPILRPAAGGEPLVSWLRRDPLPAPLHLARSLATYRHLPLADRLRLGRGALALRRLRLEDPAVDEEDLASFLARHGQREAAISALWELISLPTTNVRAADCSLALAAKVFKTGLLSDAPAADIGWSQVPLAELHADPAEQLLTRHGAVVRRRARVDALVTAEARGPVRAVRSEGELIEADAVVLAVPHTAAGALLPEGAVPQAPELAALGVSPIVDVNVVFDRRVTEYSLAAAVGSPVQFVFDRTLAAGLDPAEGQVLAVSVSAADGEHGARPEVLIERYTAALRSLFPAAREAAVIDAVVTREHEATFRGRPGSAALRPGTGTAIPNLVLAGAWTDTGWPATMEGAVRSGNRAAARVLAHLAGLGSAGLGSAGRRRVDVAGPSRDGGATNGSAGLGPGAVAASPGGGTGGGIAVTTGGTQR